MKVEVQNFGQVPSEPAPLEIGYVCEDQIVYLASGKVPALQPFQAKTVGLPCENVLKRGTEYLIRVNLDPEGQNSVLFRDPVPAGK